MKKPEPGAPATSFNVKESVVWYIVLPFLLSVFISFMLILQIRLLLKNSEDVTNSLRVSARANLMQKLMLDMESGLRGYYITGKTAYLVPYTAAQDRFEPEMQKLKPLLSETGGDPGRVDEILRLADGWMAYSKTRIEQRSKSTRTMPDEYSEGGKRMMDQIRDRFEDLLENQRRLNREHSAVVQTNTRMSVILTVILSILLSSLLSYALYRRIKNLSHSYGEVLKDLTQTKNEVTEINQHLEQTVQERTASLIAANSELEAFCYSVSHDLRAPLRGIDGFSLALAEDYDKKLDETGKQYLNYVRQGVQKMGRLIDDLLNLSRITRTGVQKKTVDVTALFKDVSADIEKNNSGLSPQKNEFKVEENLKAFADEGLLRVVLENLLSNAWKFSQKQAHPLIEMGQVVENGRNTFFIRDNGVGFDMAFKDKLFNAFQRLHSASEYSGTGIGLATVKRVIIKHGGDIWVNSELGKGTVFSFTLPDERGGYEI